MLMTPGPTEVPPSVRERMSEPMPNPDVDPAFRELYFDVTDKLATVYGTDDDVVVMGGEGILGLEAAVASLVNEGDEVLCLSNGLYGAGFADFVETYGGEPTTVEVPPTELLDAEDVTEALAGESYDVATMVHCETPTGTLNDLDEILGVLDDAGVLTVVDAVSSLGGAEVPDEGVDVCCGASQKCFSAPPGLTTLSVSDDAWAATQEGDAPSFYAHLGPWDGVVHDDAQFPYTQLPANVAALDEALDLLLDEGLANVRERHADVADYCRERARDLGLSPFPDEDAYCSPTVTALEVPGRARQLQERLADEHDVVLATGLGPYEDDVLRVGHMGYGADREKVERTMDALAAALDD
ncbi:pyridoxal-phosphate-dependent aminotransferase family protein [Halomicrococcus gelatinilyticus]|uniref:pyridoxal-phosphate-dependent aminotransferase family protein n=1 Tax=Halomicrococcus gelatinilyticus TaxID=1702103 RepID=UPI002E100A29